MTDRELDRMMQHVLLDAIKRDCEKETDDVPAFKPTRHYQRQIAAMLSDPLKWAQKRARPLWKNVAQKIAVILLVFSLSLGSLMAVSPTVRAAVVRWVTEWYETHVVYRHLGAPITGKIPQCPGRSGETISVISVFIIRLSTNWRMSVLHRKKKISSNRKPVF